MIIIQENVPLFLILHLVNIKTSEFYIIIKFFYCKTNVRKILALAVQNFKIKSKTQRRLVDALFKKVSNNTPQELSNLTLKL